MESLSILYRDQHLVALNKPPGLLVHRSEIDRHDPRNAMIMLRNQLGQWVYPLHRLDKPTSGVLLFALDQAMARQMSQAFSDKRVSKSYLAIVRGFTEEAGQINTSLKQRLDKMTDQKTNPEKPAQTALTDFQRLAIVELPHAVGRYSTTRYSFLRVMPLTGRNRQIRRHLKHIFHPIVGDVALGDGKHNDFFRQRFQCHRLLLHAHQIDFTHPYSGQPILIEAPLDSTFQRILEALQWEKIINRRSPLLSGQ